MQKLGRPKGGSNMKYSPEFKITVVEDMRNNKLSYHDTVRKYWNVESCTQAHNHCSQVKLWERIYLEEGKEGLMKERRGRATKLNNPNKGRPRKLSKEVENDLIAENQRLRMEIEYLKKLSALVLAEEQKNGKKHS